MLPQRNTNLYARYLKRGSDILFSFCGLVALSPIILFFVALIYFEMREGPFFVQERPGRHEKVFKLYKLKTMNNRTDAAGNLLPDRDRITRIGTFVRKTSIDEFPQLYNVFIGDMSLIGPRPLLVKYLPYYTERERLRHSVRPGITGLAQTSGRNTLSWDQKFAKDLEYVENLSLAMDLKIFFRTARKVLGQRDIVVDPTGNLVDLDDERRLRAMEQFTVARS